MPLQYCRRQDRLNELNQEWGAPDPAAFVRGALIASGMTETEDPRVLGLKDDKLTSTRYVAAGTPEKGFQSSVLGLWCAL